MNRILLAALVGTLTLSACDSNDPDPVAIDATVVTDLTADPTTGRDPETGAPISNDLFTLYDLDANQVVVSSDETDEAVRDAAFGGGTWDIGFKGTTIIFNGGTSGPSSVEAQLLPATPFAGLTEAPADGYLADGDNTACPAVETPAGTFPGAPFVVCTGGDNGWYNYNPAQNLITPLAGRTIVLTTTAGDYAKLRILGYYRGNPTAPDPTTDASRYYTFEYVVQPDGSRSFETTSTDA